MFFVNYFLASFIISFYYNVNICNINFRDEFGFKDEKFCFFVYLTILTIADQYIIYSFLLTVCMIAGIVFFNDSGIFVNFLLG